MYSKVVIGLPCHLGHYISLLADCLDNIAENFLKFGNKIGSDFLAYYAKQH